MAAERQIRRRIRELQKQIEKLSHEQDTFRCEMERKMEERLLQFHYEYSATLKRQKDETEELYTNRLRMFQEQIAEEMRQQYQQLRDHAEEAGRKQAEKIEELSRCNEELTELLKKMRHHTEEMEEEQSLAASDLALQVKQSRESADSTPHEFFFDGEFEIIDSHAVQIEDEIEKKMYQAASADASSVMMEFELLRVKAQQALQEWLLAFQDYGRMIHELRQRLTILEEQKIQTMAGTFHMSVTELDFWSSGMYLPFKRKIEDALAVIEKIEKQGVVPYLKANKSEQRRGMFEMVSEVRRWGDELTGIINCILSERMLSDERWIIGRKTAEMFKELGYFEVHKGFRESNQESGDEKSSSKGKKIVENPLDCYDLTETIQGVDRLQIVFVPVRENGVAVRNECMIALEARTLQDMELTREIMAINKERIESMLNGICVSTAESRENMGQCIAAEEQRKKKKPDPEAQIRHIERKYH